MQFNLTRRALFLGAIASIVTAPVVNAAPHPLYGGNDGFRDISLIPPPESPIDFPIAHTDLSKIPERFHRKVVVWEGTEEPGVIVIDPAKRFLYLTLESGAALRFGVGVGRAGFAWSGEAVIGMKRRWPRWLPPEEMVYRDAKAAKWANGMPGGPENPLGARALYLHANGEDTLFRIHGTNEPSSIGKAMSSGCIRMLNEDVESLFLRVPVGTRVVVLQASI